MNVAEWRVMVLDGTLRKKFALKGFKAFSRVSHGILLEALISGYWGV